MKTLSMLVALMSTTLVAGCYGTSQEAGAEERVDETDDELMIATFGFKCNETTCTCKPGTTGDTTCSKIEKNCTTQFVCCRSTAGKLSNCVVENTINPLADVCMCGN